MTRPSPHSTTTAHLLRARRRKNLFVLIALPLLYAILLPVAAERGLAAGLLAPAGIDAAQGALLAVLLVQLRLLTVFVVPAVGAWIVVLWAADAVLRRLSPENPQPEEGLRA